MAKPDTAQAASINQTRILPLRFGTGWSFQVQLSPDMQPLAVAWRTAAPRSERKIKDVMLWRCWGKRKGSQQNLFTKFLWVEVAVKNMEKITRSLRDIWHSPPDSQENASVSEQLVCDTNLTLSTTHAAWYSCRANDAHKLVGDRVIQVPDLRKRLEMRFWGNLLLFLGLLSILHPEKISGPFNLNIPSHEYCLVMLGQQGCLLNNYCCSFSDRSIEVFLGVTVSFTSASWGMGW